jgi:hypothetical protein
MENVMGRSPVAGIEYKNGDPGRTPHKDGPLMRGVTGGGGVSDAGSGVGKLGVSAINSSDEKRSSTAPKKW